VVSLLLPRLTPPVALVRERRTVTAQAGDVFSPGWRRPHQPVARWFRRAEYLACYLSARYEVDTWEIISRAWQLKKRVFAPVCEKNFRMHFVEITPETEIRTNSFGIYEPDEGDEVTARMLDVVITPLVAFDANLHRVGMGGGYYDRTFSFLRHRSTWLHPKLVGVAFACQEVSEIPPNPWDIPLFTVITENGSN
jgi:5-formyltetrahydrofolate cyclo-ligase